MDVILIILAPLPFFNRGRKSLQNWKGAVKFISKAFRQAFKLCFWKSTLHPFNLEEPTMDALFIRQFKELFSFFICFIS